MSPATAPVIDDVRPPVVVGVRRRMMGGEVAVHATGDVAEAALEAVLGRIAAWAGRLTRFDAASELSRLNASPSARVRIGPTLTAVLDWGRAAEGLTDGLVDIAMLDARLAAEAGERPVVGAPSGPVAPRSASRRWSLDRGPRASAVRREPGVMFDLDGVAKGWLADRALDVTPGRSALVDADGDIALRLRADDEWGMGIADPRTDGAMLGVLRFRGGQAPERFGVATSGTSVHRWTHGHQDAHHLIDPRTWRPARTDVIQATVMASSAREAEAYAKTAVIAGSDRAFGLLSRPGVHGVLILTERGQLRATTEMLRWLA